jgi:restriction endonuclease S subunit
MKKCKNLDNSLYTLELNFADPLGYTLSFWETGVMIFGLCVLISNLKIFVFSNTCSILGIFFIIAGLVIYWLSMILVSDYYVKSYNYLIY